MVPIMKGFWLIILGWVGNAITIPEKYCGNYIIKDKS
jgi:hypothetical protein